MSAYRGRTGPNYTEFLQGLNTASPPEQEQFTGELDLGGDLEMFTNANFTTQFDMPPLSEDSAFNFNIDGDKPDTDMKFGDLLTSADPGQGFNDPTAGNSPNDIQYYSNYNTPIQPAPAQGLGSLDDQSPRLSQARRKLESIQTQALSPDEESRIAAEEDKRRRNTAASARFRIKKKQREQALERNVKDANDRSSKLEAKISQLEMENKWLKDLITEKNTVQSREEIDAAYQKFKRESEERESEQHTTGIGTE